jgi:hypothetical protein
VKLVKLEVENFRGIRAASITFSSGLNVLHGPNDLGKSTLAEAIRAALLVPARSVEGRSYVGWDSAAPAHVNLIFESSGKLWRVRKTFGSGFKSVLDQGDNLDSPRFREIAHGGGVEGTLRELLSWGVAPPGGKGQSTKPTSYLVTALLGRQGEVQSIFEASLSDDKADTGRALVTKALGVLAKDPIVSRIVERLSERVDAIFTPGEKFKQAADSPLVKLQEHLKDQEERLRELKDADCKGKAIEERVVALQTERLHLLAQKQAAESVWTAAKEREERAARKATLQAVVDECTKHLNAGDRLVSALTALQGMRADGEAKSNRLKVEKDTAEAKLRETQKLMQSASEEVARASEAEAQSVLVADAMRQQRRAELESQKVSAEARLKDLDSAMKAVSGLSDLEREFRNASAAATRTSDEVAKAQLVLEHATLTAKFRELTEKQITADRLATTHESAQRREQEALENVSAAQKALTDAIGRRDDPEFVSSAPEVQEVQAELNLLQALELRLRIEAVRDQVRELEADDARARECRERASAIRSRASQIEQETSHRVLPTKEQIVSWRALQVEMEGIPASAAPIRRSPLVPVFVGLAAGLIVMLVARFVVGSATSLAILASVTIGIIVGGSIWTVGRSRARSSASEHERYRRVSERWSLEVVPSLRSAGLQELADYETTFANLESRKKEAGQLRLDAEQEDLQAAAASQAAASLESRRLEMTALQSQETFGDNPAFTARLMEFGKNLSTARHSILDAERRIEALSLSLRQAADNAVREAAAKLRDQQAAHDVLVTETASTKAQFEVARLQCDSNALHQLRQQLDGLPAVDATAKSVADAKANLEQAKNEASEASARMAVLQDQLGTMEPKVAQLVSAVGGDPSAERQKAKAKLAEIDEQLKSLESAPRHGVSSDIKALADARQKLAGFEAQVAMDRQALESATAALLEADQVITRVTTEIASKQGELKAIDCVALEAKRQTALNDPLFQVLDSEGIPLASAIAALEGVKRKFEECESRLNAAKGQLHLVAGHVGAERLVQQEEAVRYARAEVVDRELTEKAALRLLNEIQSVEAARTSHLGRTLAGPITESFRELTRGRYGQLRLDPDLKTQDITAAAAGRNVSDLSVGTREQLATLIRLAIAGHLQTAVILDDQLVHSDPEKLNWFRQQLRASAERGHQVIVFTCRPADYFPLGIEVCDDSTSVIDLVSEISRSNTLADKV